LTEERRKRERGEVEGEERRMNERTRSSGENESEKERKGKTSQWSIMISFYFLPFSAAAFFVCLLQWERRVKARAKKRTLSRR
jgi:hypothetical protein